MAIRIRMHLRNSKVRLPMRPRILVNIHQSIISTLQITQQEFLWGVSAMGAYPGAPGYSAPPPPNYGTSYSPQDVNSNPEAYVMAYIQAGRLQEALH